MVLTLKEGVCQKKGISIKKALTLLAISCNDIDIDKEIQELYVNGWIRKCASPAKKGQYMITRTGSDILMSIIADSEKFNTSDEDIEQLAQGLKEIFPKGKKEGTNNYWADSPKLIVRRLKIFFKKYGEDFTNEQILNAAKKYVESFNGSYAYMRVLKYFIFKEQVGAAGDIESTSDLLTYIENEGQENLNTNWTSTLI